MRQITRWMWIALAPTLIVSCVLSNDPTSEDTETVDQPPGAMSRTPGSAEGIPPHGPAVPNHVLSAADGPSCATCHNLGGDDVADAHRVHSAAPRAADGPSCATCHNLGGDGMSDPIIFQGADGVNGRAGLQHDLPAMARARDR
jgi:hypothetical protein